MSYRSPVAHVQGMSSDECPGCIYEHEQYEKQFAIERDRAERAGTGATSPGGEMSLDCPRGHAGAGDACGRAGADRFVCIPRLDAIRAHLQKAMPAAPAHRCIERAPTLEEFARRVAEIDGLSAKDAAPRVPGCQCHREVGDSPCRVHGEEEAAAPAPLRDWAREARDAFLGQAFDWARWPKLAAIFEQRPRENVYWQELADFVAALAPGRDAK